MRAGGPHGERSQRNKGRRARLGGVATCSCPRALPPGHRRRPKAGSLPSCPQRGAGPLLGFLAWQQSGLRWWAPERSGHRPAWAHFPEDIMDRVLESSEQAQM